MPPGGLLFLVSSERALFVAKPYSHSFVLYIYSHNFSYYHYILYILTHFQWMSTLTFMIMANYRQAKTTTITGHAKTEFLQGAGATSWKQHLNNTAIRKSTFLTKTHSSHAETNVFHIDAFQLCRNNCFWHITAMLKPTLMTKIHCVQSCWNQRFYLNTFQTCWNQCLGP
jgi:hypothetical protein